MKVKQEYSKLVKPIYEGNPPVTNKKISLSVFDLITYDAHIPLIYAYKSPTPTTVTLELGLRKALAKYRELAGRFDVDQKGNTVILLNDEGARLVEASASCSLEQAMLLKPSPSYLSLHPCLEGVNELAIIQLTRFTCGSLVIGVSTNHMVADGLHASQFFVAWAQACRGVELKTRPIHDRTIFLPRSPPQFEFDHLGREFKPRIGHCILEYFGDIVMHKFRYNLEFLLNIRSKASSSFSKNPSTIFESLVAYIWRTVAKACEQDGYKYTSLKIAVNGLTRLRPRVPKDYFGNLVLWAYPKAEVQTLINKPIKYGARLINEAVSKVNDGYFKSLIDFAYYKVDEEDLVPKLNFSDTVNCLNLNIDSWLRFPFTDLDFGGGRPYLFAPSYKLFGGQVYLVPAVEGDGSIDVFLVLHQNQMDSFKRICYSLN
ncbi:shikimate O-hydroxycinnamoyltransferase [Ranunculus cassubicifolius]